MRQGEEPMSKTYIVEMRDCIVRWRIAEADSPEAAIHEAWGRWEAGREPTEVDCNGAMVRVREVAPVTLGRLLKSPADTPKGG